MCISNLTRCVFTGDVVSIAGAGNFKNLESTGLLDTMDRLWQLPEDTLLFTSQELCKNNFEFSLKVEGKSNPYIE